MGGIYIWVHFAVRWNIQIRLVEKVFFVLQVDQSDTGSNLIRSSFT